MQSRTSEIGGTGTRTGSCCQTTWLRGCGCVFSTVNGFGAKKVMGKLGKRLECALYKQQTDSGLETVEVQALYVTLLRGQASGK
jgi:hypothetical protein